MNILNKIFKKELPTENYLSLTVTPSTVLATIWTFEKDNVRFLGFGKKSFQNLDNLIHQTAAAIDDAGQKAKSDVDKAVFGLSQYWFEEEKIPDKTLKILKNLSDDLELDPQAYISLAAAINHLYKIEESITPNAVLVGLFLSPQKDTFCEVHLIENNKVVATHTSKLEPTIERVKELISRLKQEDKALPARIIVYGSNHELVEKLQKAPWQDLFIHEPKIDILDDDRLSKSVAWAQAQDMLGREPILETTDKDILPPEKAKDSASQFGFIQGEDILLSKIDKKESENQKKEDEPPPEKPAIVREEDYAVEVQDSNVVPQDFAKSLTTVGWLPKFFSLFKPGSRLGIVVLVFLLLIAVGSYVAAQSLTSAEVLIKVNSASVEKDFKVNINTANAEISGQEITGQSASSQKAVATGTKKIGEYAKGDVTILNWTKDPKTFSTGVVVITKSGVKFSIDSDVEVASRSASTPGQAKVSVQALQFGTASNIAAGNDFTFQQYDELLYSAHNDAEFTGGDEKQVTVVSEEDLAKIEKSLTDLLIEKAKSNLKEKAQGLKLHDSAQVVKIIKKEFDKKLGEEASLINLHMEVEVSAIVYSQDDIKKYLAELASKEASDRVARPENIEIIDENAQIISSRSQNSLALSGKFRARLVPKFTDSELKDKIAGKSVKDTRSIIKSLPDVADVQVKFSPNLPFVDSIPQNKSNIKFKIE